MQPTLLNGCASAATAAETRFRIDRPIPGRSACVVALDDGAAAVVQGLVARASERARFFTPAGPAAVANGDGGAPADVALRGFDGSESRLSEELADADVAIVVAKSDDGADVASAIARACDRRGVMTAALILGEALAVRAAVSALRPYAPVLLVTEDEGDVAELLTALRA